MGKIKQNCMIKVPYDTWRKKKKDKAKEQIHSIKGRWTWKDIVESELDKIKVNLYLDFSSILGETDTSMEFFLFIT